MDKLNDFFKNFEKNFCVFLMTAILIVLTIQVVGRYVFNYTPQWSEELARYLFIWLTFTGIGYAAQQNAHIRIEAFNNMWPKSIRKVIAIIGELIWVAFNIIIIYVSAKYTYGVFASKQVSVAVKINMGWAYLAIPFGYALMTIRIIANIIKGKLFDVTSIEN